MVGKKRFGRVFSLGLAVCVTWCLALRVAVAQDICSIGLPNVEFGDGSDGDLDVYPPGYELEPNKNYRSITVHPGATLDTQENILRVCGTLTNDGTITDNQSGGGGGSGGGDGGRGSGVDKNQHALPSGSELRDDDHMTGEPSQAGDVVLRFSSPGPSPQDLAWDGKHLWVADDNTDKIYKLDPSDGTVLSSFAVPGSDPRGLAWDGTHLWSSDDSTHKIYKLDRGRSTPVSVVDAPILTTRLQTSPLGGLAWDGQCVWSGWIAGWSSRMNQVNPKDGSVKMFLFTKGLPRALASDGKFLWSATDNGGIRSGIIYKYDLSDGLYVSQIDTPGRYPTGLAFDGQYLWCADVERKAIYKLVAE